MVRYIRESIEDDFEEFDLGDDQWVVKIPKECIKGVTLLSKEEYVKYRDNIPETNHYWWWLRSAGPGSQYARYANPDGNARGDYYDSVYNASYGIRPALLLNLQSFNLDIGAGDKFEFGEHSFTIISNDLAICDDFISRGHFSPDSNIYEKSDVKKFVDNWFNEAYRNYEG